MAPMTLRMNSAEAWFESSKVKPPGQCSTAAVSGEADRSVFTDAAGTGSSTKAGLPVSMEDKHAILTRRSR